MCTGLIIDKFDNGKDIQFNKTTVHKHYCHDTTLDFIFEVVYNSDPVIFFLKLYNENDYCELARLALLIFSILQTTL